MKIFLVVSLNLIKQFDFKTCQSHFKLNRMDADRK